MSFLKSVSVRSRRGIFLASLLGSALGLSSAAKATEASRQAWDQELSLSLGYSQNGDVGLVYGLHLSPSQQIELGAGISIIGGMVNGTYKYYFSPEQKLSPFVNVGLVRYEEFRALGFLIGGGLHYLVNDHLSLACSLGTIPMSDGENATLFSIELARVGLRF